MFTKEGALREIETERLEDAKADVHISPNDDEAANEAILRAEMGEQVLWVENTVAGAQKRYCLLAAKAREVGVDCGLLHSRFLKTDRQKNENKWVGLFGKTGRDSRPGKRTDFSGNAGIGAVFGY